MEFDEDKVDDAVLALMFLGIHEEDRTWKGFDWGALDRLHEKGMISNPKGKAKSVWLTEQGRARSEDLFKKMFGASD